MNNEVVYLKDYKRKNYFSFSVSVVFAALILIFSFMSENFFTFSNIYNVLLNGSPLIIITMGLTFALLTGTMDMSVAAVAYISGCIFGILYRLFGFSMPLSIMIALMSSALVGLINAILVIRLRLDALVVTLGMMMVIRSFGKIVTRDRLILMGSDIAAIRQSRITGLGGFPAIIIVTIIVVVLCALILKYTKFGRNLIAVGCNEQSARNIGINVDLVKAGSLILSSSISGIAGIVWVITLGSVISRGLNSYEFLAVASAVLGGTSLFGGRGSFFPGSILGVLIYLFISNGLSIVGTSPFVIPLIRGAIIFIAMYADSLRTRAERNILA